MRTWMMLRERTQLNLIDREPYLPAGQIYCDHKCLCLFLVNIRQTRYSILGPEQITSVPPARKRPIKEQRFDALRGKGLYYYHLGNECQSSFVPCKVHALVEEEGSRKLVELGFKSVEFFSS